MSSYSEQLPWQLLFRVSADGPDLNYLSFLARCTLPGLVILDTNKLFGLIKKELLVMALVGLSSQKSDFPDILRIVGNNWVGLGIRMFKI